MPKMNENGTKICTKCGKEKPISEFAKDKRSGDGYTYWCKECRNEHNRKYLKENPEKAKEHNDKWKERRKEYYKRPENAIKLRNSHLKRNFNITVEEYNQMFKEQNGVCAICGSPEVSDRNFNLCIDHDHETGKIRGLLCNKCNRGLGYFLDNPKILENALKYLLKHKIQK